MIRRAIKMINEFLNGEYDPLDFSYDFPDFLIENYDFLENENENEIINEALNDNLPEICAEYEIGADAENFKGEVQAEYERILKKGGTAYEA